MEAGLDDSGVRFFQQETIGNTHLHFCNIKDGFLAVFFYCNKSGIHLFSQKRLLAGNQKINYIYSVSGGGEAGLRCKWFFDLLPLGDGLRQRQQVAVRAHPRRYNLWPFK